MKKGDLAFNVLRVPVDYIALVMAGLATYALRTRVLDIWRPVQFTFNLPLSRYLILVLAFSALLVGVYAISGLYAMRVRLSMLQELSRVFVATSAGVLGVILFIFLRQELFNSRFLVIGFWFLAFMLVSIGRLLFRHVFRAVSGRTGWGRHRVLIIGDDTVTEAVARTVQDDPAWGYDVVKRMADPDIRRVHAAVGNPGVDEVILANPNYPADRIVPLVEYCHERHITFSFVPNIYQTLTTHYAVDAIGNIPVVQLRRTALDGWGRVFKRVVDMFGAVIGLVVFSPLLAVVAFAIKWETAGPVMVRLTRISGSRRFKLFKFRSMVENAEALKPLLAARNERADGPLFKMQADPRITRVGRLIRKTRLDELPQFYNVLIGDMSLVGPRPHQPDEIAKYAKHHKRVLAIKAGATGLAQVSGSSDLPFEEEVKLDTFYIENWSLGMDTRIIVKTALKMLQDRSAV